MEEENNILRFYPRLRKLGILDKKKIKIKNTKKYRSRVR